MIADGEPGDTRPHPLHDPGALVAADDRVPDRDVAGAPVVVGVAQARRDEPHEDLAGLRLVQVELDDLEVLADVPEHRCSCLHANPTLSGSKRSLAAIIRLMAPGGHCGFTPTSHQATCAVSRTDAWLRRTRHRDSRRLQQRL